MDGPDWRDLQRVVDGALDLRADGILANPAIAFAVHC